MSYLFAFPSVIFTDHYSNINKNRQTQTFPYKNLDSLHKCLTLHPQTGKSEGWGRRCEKEQRALKVNDEAHIIHISKFFISPVSNPEHHYDIIGSHSRWVVRIFKSSSTASSEKKCSTKKVKNKTVKKT